MEACSVGVCLTKNPELVEGPGWWSFLGIDWPLRGHLLGPWQA